MGCVVRLGFEKREADKRLAEELTERGCEVRGKEREKESEVLCRGRAQRVNEKQERKKMKKKKKKEEEMDETERAIES